MQKFLAIAAAAFLPITALAAQVLLPPPDGATGDDVAIIWIHGASCKPEAYTSYAINVQNHFMTEGKRLWIGIPEFILDTPNPF